MRKSGDIKDPQTGEEYIFELTGQTSYKVCANFSIASKDIKDTNKYYFDKKYEHPKGYYCFNESVVSQYSQNAPTNTSSPAPSPLVKVAFSFENGFEGWIPYVAAAPGNAPSGNVELSNDFAWEGDYSIKIWGTNGIGDAYAFRGISNLQPGEKYVFSAYVRAKKEVSGKAYIKVQGGSLAVKSEFVPISGLTTWRRIILPFVAISTSHELDLIANEMVNGGELYWDAVQVEKGNEPSDFTREIAPGTSSTY